MDAKVRENLHRAQQAVIDIPPGRRGHAEEAVLSFWYALTYALLEQPFEANEHAHDVADEIYALNKQRQMASEKERVR